MATISHVVVMVFVFVFGLWSLGFGLVRFFISLIQCLKGHRCLGELDEFYLLAGTARVKTVPGWGRGRHKAGTYF